MTPKQADRLRVAIKRYALAFSSSQQYDDVDGEAWARRCANETARRWRTLDRLIDRLTKGGGS